MGNNAPWIRPDDIIETVADWTGISRGDGLLLTSDRPHCSRRVLRARVLLARCLQVGLDCSKQDVGRIMGYSTRRDSLVSHLFKKDWDASEVAAVVNLAKDRRGAA